MKKKIKKILAFSFALLMLFSAQSPVFAVASDQIMPRPTNVTIDGLGIINLDTPYLERGDTITVTISSNSSPNTDIEVFMHEWNTGEYEVKDSVTGVGQITLEALAPAYYLVRLKNYSANSVTISYHMRYS